MLLTTKLQDEAGTNPDLFKYTSEYIQDELELIHEEQDNLVTVSEELRKATQQTRQMKDLLKLIKKTDKTVLKGLEDKRKQSSSLINLFEEVKNLLKNERYEDIERLMLKAKQKSQAKIKLSEKEMHDLKDVMGELEDSYKIASGLCRLYQLMYDNVKKIYDGAGQELRKETTEDDEMRRAGPYTEKVR